MYTFVAIIGLAILMIVHEGGHFLMARRAGMRVTKFSIGFGPTFFKIVPIDESANGEKDRGVVRNHGEGAPQSYFWFMAFGDRLRFRLKKYDPAIDGPTIYQVGMIPFLAYVQIAGMNPLEEIDPKDKGAYPNAGLLSRVLTIAAGPLANYLFASVFFFIPFFIQGENALDGTHVRLARTADEKTLVADTPAQAAGLQDDDRILEIDGVRTAQFEDIPKQIEGKGGKTVHLLVQRGEEKVDLDIVPQDDNGVVRIGVQGIVVTRKLSVGQAAVKAVVEPTKVVRQVLTTISDKIHGRDKAPLSSAVGIVKVMSKAAKDSWADFVTLLGYISAYLAVFNLLPVPALDGGRLMFLGFEAVTRKKPNATMEAQIHAVGIVMLLGLMLYVTLANDLGLASKQRDAHARPALRRSAFRRSAFRRLGSRLRGAQSESPRRLARVRLAGLRKRPRSVDAHGTPRFDLRARQSPHCNGDVRSLGFSLGLCRSLRAGLPAHARRAPEAPRENARRDTRRPPFFRRARGRRSEVQRSHEAR